jgi:shikimate kinase
VSTEALQAIENIAVEVNESIRRRENEQKLREISDMVQGIMSLVKPGRVRGAAVLEGSAPAQATTLKHPTDPSATIFTRCYSKRGI